MYVRRRLGILAVLTVVIAGSVAPAWADTSLGLDRGPRRHRPHVTRGTRTYAFKTGVLRRDHLARWTLDDGTLLTVDASSVWVDDARRGAPALPTEGRRVRIMGVAGPGGFSVRHGVLIDPQDVLARMKAPPEAIPDQPLPDRPR